MRCVFERDERRARVVSASAWGSLRYGEHRDLELTLDAPMVFDSLTRFALRQGEERTAAGVVLASR